MKLLLFLLASLLLGAGCSKGPKETRQFRLPEGDAANGQAAFVALRCHQCHTLPGVTLPAPTAKPDEVVALGGDVVRLRTYGELLTAIVHPAYELSDKLPPATRARLRTSPMRSVNDEMTVRQLVDLVVFLQPHYRQLNPLYEQNYQLSP